MTANTITPHQDGDPWKTVGRYPTFALADIQRSELLEVSNIQVKVHYQGPENNRYFAVKMREDPDIGAALKKKEEKARRKKRLSKKRRKR